jgi:hypothetical protein
MLPEMYRRDVPGLPLTRTYTFLAAHEYVAYYDEHLGLRPEREPDVADVATNALDPQQMYWSLAIVDLAEAGVDHGPEVRDARAYNAWVNDLSEAQGK